MSTGGFGQAAWSPCINNGTGKKAAPTNALTGLTLDVFSLGDDAEDGLGAALVAEVVVPALPRPVPEEGEAARQEERVGPRLAPPRQPLALGGHRQVRAGAQQRRPARRGRPEDALAGLAVVDLKTFGEIYHNYLRLSRRKWP